MKATASEQLLQTAIAKAAQRFLPSAPSRSSSAYSPSSARHAKSERCWRVCTAWLLAARSGITSREAASRKSLLSLTIQSGKHMSFRRHQPCGNERDESYLPPHTTPGPLPSRLFVAYNGGAPKAGSGRGIEIHASVAKQHTLTVTSGW